MGIRRAIEVVGRAADLAVAGDCGEERVAVEAVEHGRLVGDHRGGAGDVAQQRDLAERVSGCLACESTCRGTTRVSDPDSTT